MRQEGPRPAPRYWAPPPGSVANPVQPCAGEWKTWVMTAGNQFRPGPPPVFGSPQFTADAREMVATKNALTDDQKKAATFWAGGQGTPLPAGVWMNVLLAYLHNELPSEPKAERTLALASVAISDAGVASWDAKFTHWNPRPENGVRDSGVDKNWKPYIDTPFFPPISPATPPTPAPRRLPRQGPGGVGLPPVGRHPLAGRQHRRHGGRQEDRPLVVERAKTDGGSTG